MSAFTPSRSLRLAATIALAWLVACSSSESSAPEQQPPPAVASVAVSAPTTSLLVGEQVTLTATPKDAAGNPLARPVTWRSEDAARATITAAGAVIAIAAGTVDIVAASEGREGRVTLTVVVAPVAEVRLSVDDVVELEFNGATQLSAKAYDGQGNELPGRAVQWLSSNPLVVTISATGVVEARGVGTAMIGATIDGVGSQVGVRVKPAPIARVVLDAPWTALELGENAFFTAILEDAGGQQLPPRAVSWTSSDPAVATVTSNHPGLAAVTAVGTGPVSITASAEGKDATITFTITPRPTHDLIYTRWTVPGAAEIFVLGLGGAATPIRINAGTVSRDPSPSPDGLQLAFAVSQTDPFGKPQHDLYIVNRNGMNMRWLTRVDGLEDQPAWSPDGTKILFHASDAQGGNPNLWVINVDGTGPTNLTAGLPADVVDKRDPAWSFDGSRIAFVAARNGQHKIWTMNADGSNAAQLTTDIGFDSSPTWSPTGDRIAFSRYSQTPGHGEDIMVLSLAGGSPFRLALPGDQRTPVWSPDGHYLAVAGTLVGGTGAQQIYTMRPDGSGLRLRTVNSAWGGGASPSWIVRQ